MLFFAIITVWKNYRRLPSRNFLTCTREYLVYIQVPNRRTERLRDTLIMADIRRHFYQGFSRLSPKVFYNSDVYHFQRLTIPAQVSGGIHLSCKWTGQIYTVDSLFLFSFWYCYNFLIIERRFLSYSKISR